MQSKLSKYEYQNLIKMMPLRVAYHSLSTTSYVQQSILGRPCSGLWVIHRRCNILSPHNPCDNPVKLCLRTLHWKYGIWHLLASKSPCNAYISKSVSEIPFSKSIKVQHLATSYQFSSKTCQSVKPDFEIAFIKFQLFRKNSKHKFTTLVL